LADPLAPIWTPGGGGA